MRMDRCADFARGLSLAALALALVLVDVSEASAQFAGRGKSFAPNRTEMVVPPAATAPRAGIVSPPSVGTTYPGRIVTPPRSAGGKIANPGRGDASRPPRGPTGPVVGDTTPPSGGGVRPPRPGRPGYGPVVGPGVIIGSGVVIGSAVAAAPPPPPPLGSGGGGVVRPPPGAGPAVDIPPANERRFLPNEVVLEFAGNVPPQVIADLARRHRLERLDEFSLGSTNTTYVRARIVDGRPVRAVLAALRREVGLRAGQPNYLYAGTQQASDAATSVPPTGTIPSALGDPAQYALAKLRLPEAHGLARGDNVLVAVIDSGIDASHPELSGVITGTFDALHKAARPHAHGTAMAGTIAARSRLSGVAPAARILAIRAFGASSSGVTANTFAILKGIDHAVRQNVRVINMSFAGPSDPGFARVLAAAKARGIVLVASAGNHGPMSPPQYPAADPNVIAVTATDASDRLFASSNRGSHVALAAPGVDILVPVPGANYDLTSGTSVAAAHVSGVVALILGRQPGLDPDTVRRILQSSARDLGPAGMDDQFGAGLVDAYQAVLSIEARAAVGPQASPNR